MRIRNAKEVLHKSVLIFWATLTIVIFVFYPGRVAFVQGSSIEHWREFPSKFESIQPIGFLLNLSASMLGIFIYGMASTSLGTFIAYALLKEDGILRLERGSSKSILIATYYLIGQLILSIIYLALGIFGRLSRAEVWITVFVSAALGGRHLHAYYIKNWRGNLAKHIQAHKRERVSSLLILALLTLFAGSLLSNSRISYDSTALYFSSAKLTALSHKVQVFQTDSFMASALQTGIHHAVLILLFGDQAARMHSWLSGVAIILFTIGLGRKAGLSRRAGVYLLILILTSTALLDSLGDGKVDLASTAPALAAYYWLTYDKEKTSSAKRIIAGAMTGLAMISRPYNVPLLVGVIGFMSVDSLRRNGFRKSFHAVLWQALTLVTPIVILGLIHLAINQLALGNALAPLSDIRRVNTQDWQWRINPNQMWVLRFLYPLVVTFYNNPQSGGNITPFFIGFLPSLFFEFSKIKTKAKVTVVVIPAIITLFLWVSLIFSVVEIRYVLFLWLIALLLPAATIDQIMTTSDRFIQTFTTFLLIMMLVFSFTRILYVTLDTYSPIDKNGNPICKDLIYCTVFDSINLGAKPGERVLALSAYRYYLRTDLLSCSSQGVEYERLRSMALQSSDAFWEEVYYQGYTYIAYERHYSAERLFIAYEPNPTSAPSWIRIIPIYGKPGDALVAYRITFIDPPNIAQTACLKDNLGIWTTLQ